MSSLKGTWLALLAAGLLAACATGGEGVDPDRRLQAENAYEQGLKALSENRYAIALTALQQAVAFDATVPAYPDALGLVYVQLGQPGAALQQFQRAVQLDPKYANGHFHVGVALAEAMRWPEAVEAYRRALALPTLTVPDQAHHNLGVALFNLKRYADAEAEILFALGLDPGMQAGYYDLGLVLQATDRKDAAKAAFLRARQLSPDSAFGRAALDRLRAMGEGGG